MHPLPLFTLHGFTGTPSSFKSLSIDGAKGALLSGHGTSPDLGALHFTEETRRISQLITQEYPEKKVHLLGYSMGARVALSLLAEYPHLVGRATLIGVNPGLRRTKARSERLKWEATWRDILTFDGIDTFVERWECLPLFDSQQNCSQEEQLNQHQARLSHQAAGLAHALQVLGLGSMPDYWESLQSISCPVDCVVGDLDEKFSDIAVEMDSLSPMIRIHQLKNVGHNPLLEAPALVSKIVNRPLRGVSS